MDATVIGAFVVSALALFLVLRSGVHLLRGEFRADPLGANGLIGAVAGLVVGLAYWFCLAAATGPVSGEVGGIIVIVTVFLTVMGGITGLVVGALKRGVRVVTFGNFIRVLLCGSTVMFLGGVFGMFLGGLVTLLPFVGLYVGMSASTTRPPESGQPNSLPKPPADSSPGNGTGTPRTETQGDTDQDRR
ncbi:MAG: hypothetical protein FJ290_15320 [Planctomycetes bacterium]|nr:hypothetical protein [Planctomycetota bacterium]